MHNEEIARIKARHRDRPIKLRKGKSWVCKCQTINVYEQEQCKMIQVQIDKFVNKANLAALKNAGLLEPKEKVKRVQFKTHKAERQTRADLLQVFTGSVKIGSGARVEPIESRPLRSSDYDDFGNPIR